MYIEYFINSVEHKDIEIKNSIEDIHKNNIINVCTLPYYAKSIKRYYPSMNIGLLIDYPLGLNSSDLRSLIINHTIDRNVKYINIPIQFNLMINRKYDKIREDIKCILDSISKYDVKIRYVLEYRKFDHNILLKVCEILMQNNINCIYPSTGFFVDNIEDNIIACAYLKKKTGIDTIINGNAWTSQHIQNIIKSGLYGFSSNNILAIKMIQGYNDKSKQE